MKHQIVLSACLLLLWTLTEAQKPEDEISATRTANGIKLHCKGIIRPLSDLDYKDENTGEYTCFSSGQEGTEATEATEEKVIAKIFVKFRTCDNCVELDVGSICGIVAGDVVATFAIGVAVYLIASQARIGPIGPIPSNKKSSDRQHLVPNEMSSRSGSGDHYQRLKPRSGQKDTYDVLHRK